jgi:hypothetical protein
MSQHNIIGSEAFNRSPLVIIRSVRTGGMRRRQTRTAFAFVAGACAAVVDCGFRVPTEPIDATVQIGDAVAPRTIHEAVLEARRAALAI